jgi:hypothetical protein
LTRRASCRVDPARDPSARRSIGQMNKQLLVGCIAVMRDLGSHLLGTDHEEESHTTLPSHASFSDVRQSLNTPRADRKQQLEAAGGPTIEESNRQQSEPTPSSRAWVGFPGASRPLPRRSDGAGGGRRAGPTPANEPAEGCKGHQPDLPGRAGRQRPASSLMRHTPPAVGQVRVGSSLSCPRPPRRWVGPVGGGVGGGPAPGVEGGGSEGQEGSSDVQPPAARGEAGQQRARRGGRAPLPAAAAGRSDGTRGQGRLPEGTHRVSRAAGGPSWCNGGGQPALPESAVGARRFSYLSTRSAQLHQLGLSFPYGRVLHHSRKTPKLPPVPPPLQFSI